MQLATTSMETAVSDIQRQLTGSNLSDDEYRALLLKFLHQQNLKPHIEALQGNDLQEFVDCLDSALNRISTADDLFRGTLHRLRSACSNRGVLPSSYFIPNGMISNRGGPVAAGGFADVYEAEFNGKKVCVKALRAYSQDTDGVTKKAFHKEVVVWKRLQHPNIVTFLGVPTKIPPFEIVCEWMENDRIDKYVARHPHVDFICLLWDVADGLYYLHSSEVIHGDLKGVSYLALSRPMSELDGNSNESEGKYPDR